MMGNTHMASAAAVFTAGSILTTQNPHPELLPVVILASIMPDADHPKSKVGRRLTTLILPSLVLMALGWIGVEWGILNNHQFFSYLPYLIIMLITGLLPYILYYIIGHRTVTHSVFVAVPFFIIAFVFQDQIYGPFLLAFAVGYALHMLGDYTFDEGIVLFWPFQTVRYKAPIRFKTNGFFETLIMYASYAAVLILYYTHYI